MKNHVGPYLLQDILGKGGMGVVWRAVHVETGTPVAMKVMRAEPTTSRGHTVFLNEINQASKLNHPNITTILDFAETTSEDAQHDSGLIRPDQPWIAMELARRGSLDQLDNVLTWKDLYGICNSLLSALANAHARGILHRDIKPGNILLGSPDDFRPSIKLSDFGLAMTHNDVVSPHTGLRVVGTPEYMAPEQIEGLWRDQGPWTDLYSLGCVAYELASGWPPFSGESHRDVVLGHLSSPVPPLRAMSVLPDAFEDWLTRMLAKEPVDRFQCAADAAHALFKIDHSAEDDSPLPGPQRTNSASPTWTFMNIDLPQVRRARAPSGPVIHPEDAPNLVADWRNLVPKHIHLPLISASLSLVGVKKTRIVGRHHERDRLWAALHEVSHSGYPKAVILKGAAGNGKQRLAQWVAETAHEAGMAQILSAEHGAIPSPAHGLPRMFAQLLHTRNLHGAEVLERTSEMLTRLGIDDPFEAQSLSRILLATSGAVSSPTTVSTGALSERLALYERLVQRMTDHRPIVIVIKNAQWAAEALQFANRLMRNRGSELPVLLVMTCDDEHMLQRQHELRQIEHLGAMPTCETIEVGPLPDEDASALIEDLLRVDPHLARDIARRSEGSPLFAIQMVEDLVERGLLQAAPLGFRLKDNAQASLPPTVHALWKRRLDVTLDAMHPTARSAVLVGAALGVTVESSEWEAACAALDIDIPSSLLTRLARADLIDVTDSGWAFTHGLLRECIAQENNEGWSSINLACANMLDDSPASAGKAGRIGQHLIAAERRQESLPYLRDGAKQAQKSGVFDDALSLLDHHQNALQALSIDQTDERWGQQWYQQIVVLYNLRRFDRAQPLALNLCNAALENNWTVLLPIALRWRGLLATANNEFDEALDLFAQSERVLGEGQEVEHAVTLRHWSELLRRIGHADASRQKLDAAAEVFQRHDEHSELALTRYQQAALQNVLFQDHGRALELLEEAQQLHTRQGDNMGVADCWNGIAEIHRAKGNLADAEAAYQQSERFFSRAGIGTEIIPKLNRGLLQLQRNQFADARELLMDVQLGLSHGSWGALMPCVHAGLMVCAASTADWETWENHETQLRSALEKSPMVERDLAEPLERAAEIAQVEGQTDYAVRTWQLAQEQWRSIGDDEAVARIERRINSHLSKKNS